MGLVSQWILYAKKQTTKVNVPSVTKTTLTSKESVISNQTFKSATQMSLKINSVLAGQQVDVANVSLEHS